MKDVVLKDLMLELSVKKEFKDHLYPVWRELRRIPNVYVGHPYQTVEERVGFNFEASVSSYMTVHKAIDLVRDFYPEAKVKLEVSDF